MSLNKFIYIAEFNLPSTSAYSIHVMKICDTFAKFFKSTLLIIPCKNNSYSFRKIKKDYNIKKNFLITSLFKNKKINFFFRLIFAFKVLCKLYSLKNDKEVLIYSRSIQASILLSIFQIKNYLEIHHDLKGLSKFLFILASINFFRKNLQFILLHKNLLKVLPPLKNKYIILDDAVDINDFKLFNKKKIKKNTCAYFGSLTLGKGLEVILSIAKKLKEINFHIYTDKNLINKNFRDFPNNIFFFDYIPYSKVPSVIQKYNVVLMPYQNKVLVRSNNLETSRFMSPLKLFDYLASGKIIIASNLKVYSHILRNNFNSILVHYNDIDLWCKKIKQIFKYPKKFNNIKINARITARKYTWNKRVKNIIVFFKQI
jgi:glycosyltransferase involved in cell wall biosynthesis